MVVAAGALELCAWLDSLRVPRALVTRNVARARPDTHAHALLPEGRLCDAGLLSWVAAPGSGAVSHFHTHHFPHAAFHPAIDRDWGPWKPSPGAQLGRGRKAPHVPDAVFLCSSCDEDLRACVPRPAAAALEHICEQWGIATSEAVMIGDSAKVRPHVTHGRTKAMALACPSRVLNQQHSRHHRVASGAPQGAFRPRRVLSSTVPAACSHAPSYVQHDHSTPA